MTHPQPKPMEEAELPVEFNAPIQVFQREPGHRPAVFIQIPESSWPGINVTETYRVTLRDINAPSPPTASQAQAQQLPTILAIVRDDGQSYECAPHPEAARRMYGAKELGEKLPCYCPMCAGPSADRNHVFWQKRSFRNTNRTRNWLIES